MCGLHHAWVGTTAYSVEEAGCCGHRHGDKGNAIVSQGSLLMCYVFCRPAVPARLQLVELQRLLAACDALPFLAESAGARPVLTLRNAVQVCKSFPGWAEGCLSGPSTLPLQDANLL